MSLAFLSSLRQLMEVFFPPLRELTKKFSFHIQSDGRCSGPGQYSRTMLTHEAVCLVSLSSSSRRLVTENNRRFFSESYETR